MMFPMNNRKGLRRVLALLLSLVTAMSVASPAFALDLLNSAFRGPSAAAATPEITGYGETHLIKSNDQIKAVKIATWSNGATEAVDATEFNGILTYGSNAYLIKDGLVDKSFSGTKKKGKTTYTFKNGKSTKVMIDVPRTSQMPNYPTGCEGSAMASLLQFYGINASVSECVNAIPRQNVTTKNGKRYGPSIYEKFAGNPRGGYTSANPGYGAFAPCVTKSLNKVISNKGKADQYQAVDITGSKVGDLYKLINEGTPTIVWATYNMQNPKTVNSWYAYNSKTGKYEYFKYPRGTHVMILRGYDANNVYIMDPYQGSLKTFSRSSFNYHYGQMWVDGSKSGKYTNLTGYQAIKIVKK